MPSIQPAGPKMVLDVSPKEKNSAKEIKASFKITLKKMHSAILTVLDLRDSIVNQRPEKKELVEIYSGRLLRYRRKIKNEFNEFLLDIKKSLERLSELMDPNMIRLREIIVAEVGELSSGAEAIMRVLRETDRDGFTKRIEEVSAQMEKRERSIVDVIDSQLFSHIDHDILGRMKISEMKFRIRRRARIIKQMVR